MYINSSIPHYPEITSDTHLRPSHSVLSTIYLSQGTGAGRMKTDPMYHIANLGLISSLGQGPPSCLVFVQHLHHWCPSQRLDAIMTQITTLFRTGVRAPANQRNYSGSLKNKSFHAAPGNASSKYLGFLCF